MVRALDHLVLPCPDLAVAAARFEALGFLVGRRNRHPWGTENHIVQFADAFLELFAFAADAAPPAPGSDAFAFAGFLAGLAGTKNPSGMVVLRSDDAERDASAFRAAGLGGARLDFGRTAAGPDGRPRTVSFSLAFAAMPAMPAVGAFVCQQHQPENFWNTALQGHPNGVAGIEVVEIALAEPPAVAPALGAFSGAALSGLPDGGFAVDCGNGRLAVMPDRAAPEGRLRAVRFRRGRAIGTSFDVTLDTGLRLTCE